MIMGYKVLAQVSYKKAAIIIAIYEFIMIVAQIGLTSIAMTVTQGMMPA